MLTFYYIEQWRYYHPRLFPTLNLLLFPAQTYGINLMGYDHIIRTRPTPSLTMPPFHRRIWWKKRHLWMNWWKPISLSHTTMLPLRHLMSYLHPRSCLREHHHHRIGNRKPNPPQRRLPSVVADVTNPDPAPRAHCHSGRSKTSRNYAHWRLTRSLDFHGRWSRPRWASPRKMFALCGIRSKTNLADQRHMRTKRKGSLRHCITASPTSWSFLLSCLFPLVIFKT